MSNLNKPKYPPLLILSPVHRAHRRITEHLRLMNEKKQWGVAHEEGHIMCYLLSYAPCSMNKLHDVFGLPRTTLSSTIDRLEREDWVVREANPEDRRSINVRLTPAGRKMAQKLRRGVEQIEVSLMKNISAKDLEGYQRVMAAINELEI